MTNVIELAKQAGIGFQENTGITGRKKVTTYGSQPIEKIELLIKLVRNASLEEVAALGRIGDRVKNPALVEFVGEINELKEPTP